eukprot:6833371-Prymnesium_polylepis.1
MRSGVGACGPAARAGRRATGAGTGVGGGGRHVTYPTSFAIQIDVYMHAAPVAPTGTQRPPPPPRHN